MTQTPTREVIRLRADQFRELESQLQKPFVQCTTTAHQAGFMLGIQHVLGILREGYVIGEGATL